MIITIDGPSGSGKSTVAQKIAQQLSIFYLNTGLLYRAVAYLLLEDTASAWYKKYDQIDAESVTPAQLAALPALVYAYGPTGGSATVQGRDITAHLYATPGLEQAASKLSAQPAVRAYLLDVQRAIAAQHDVIADGRDCGTVVFPAAQHKIYLTASLEARTNRRLRDSKAQALGLTFDQVYADIAARDERDFKRVIAPLCIPPGATIIDSSDMSIDEVVGLIVRSVAP
jgi:cytidylate kinase